MSEIVTAEDMVRILRETCRDNGFFCPLAGMYPCELTRRGCYCHELHLINHHQPPPRWIYNKVAYDAFVRDMQKGIT